MQCSNCREIFSWASGRFSKTQWMKGGAARCKSCVSASGSVGGATGDGYGGFETVRNNNSSRYKTEDSSEGSNASIETGYLFGSGAFKDVFKGVYVSGPRRGEDVVAKRFKDGVNSRADYFEKDVKAAQAAAKIVEKFNRINPTRALHPPPPPHTQTTSLFQPLSHRVLPTCTHSYFGFSQG